MPTTYERRRAAGLCCGCGHCPPETGHVYCADCLEGMNPGRTRHAQARALRPRGSPEDVAPLIAHCGQWHPIVSIPLVVSCCGATLLAATGPIRTMLCAGR